MHTITGVFGSHAAETLSSILEPPQQYVSGPGYAMAGPSQRQNGLVEVRGGPDGASAGFDETQGTGFLTRDRMGQQSLFLLRQPERLCFSTDLKTLLRAPGYSPRLHLEAVHHYLSYQEVPAPLTLFAGITRLPPAHRQNWREGRLPTPERYWKLDWSKSAAPGNEAEYTEEVLQALRSAMQRRPVDTFLLSGQAESTLLLALAAESSRPLRTYTLAESAPAAEQARQVARHYGTEHHELEPLPLDRILEQQVEFYAEPRTRPLLGLPEPLQRAVSGLGGRALLGSRLAHELSALGPASEDWLQRYQLLTFTDEEKERLYDPRMLEELQGYSSLQLLKRRYSHLSATDPWNRALEADLGAFESWSHLAHELQCPYLDEHVSQLLAAAPVSLKRSQALLTRLGNGRVPAPAEQPSIPPGLLELAESWLSGDELEKGGLFSPASVRRLQERTRAQDPRSARQLLTLLAFQAWHRRFIEAPLALPGRR